MLTGIRLRASRPRWLKPEVTFQVTRSARVQASMGKVTTAVIRGESGRNPYGVALKEAPR